MNTKTLSGRLRPMNYTSITSGRNSFDDTMFAFMKPPKKNVVMAATDITYCRESLCEYIRQQFKKVGSYGIDTRMLHMVAYRRVPIKTGAIAFNSQIEAALKVLNTVESHYGWPLTRVYPLTLIGDQATVDSRNQFYYVRSTKRWMKAPAMLSMYLLLFRIACLNKRYKFIQKITSFKTLFEVLIDLSKRSSGHELAYFRIHGDRWPLVLDNYQKLFGKRDMKDLYWPNTKSYLFSEGINTLCDCDSEDKKLRAEFKSIITKEYS
jgi:hypothetical protein